VGTIPKANEGYDVRLGFNPYQARFLTARRKRLPDGRRAFRRFGLFAGRRGGKTRIGAIAAVEEAAEHPYVPGEPEMVGWCCAPTYPELHDYVLPAVLMALPRPWIADWSAERHEAVLINGFKLRFRSLEDPERARGSGLTFLWIDEARKVAELAWKTARPALADRLGAAYLTTSPNGQDWCYRSFYDPALHQRPGYWACKYKSRDNPLPSIQAEYEAAKVEYADDPLWFQQEWEGDFVTFAGAVYGGLVPPQVLTTDAQIRTVIPEWPRIDRSRQAIVGLDPGADHPFAGVLVLITEAGLVVLGEYCERNRPIAEHVLGLKALEGSVPIDRRAIDRSQKQIAIELMQHGMVVHAAENAVVAGIHRVASWLRARQLWFVKSLCPRLIEQLQNYQWDENFGKDGEAKRERVKKVKDDLPDALRYAVMLWPEMPRTDVAIPTGRSTPVPAEAQWAHDRLARLEADEGDPTGVSWAQFLGTAGEHDGPWEEGFAPVDADHPLGDFYR
jgi:hypothetical protein